MWSEERRSPDGSCVTGWVLVGGSKCSENPSSLVTLSMQDAHTDGGVAVLRPGSSLWPVFPH